MQFSPKTVTFEFPSGPVPLNSPLYIERFPVEQLAYAEIERPNSLLRLKAARAMGKSSLLNRILAHAETQGYRVACIDLQEADEAILVTLDRFLRWFSTLVSHALQQPPCLDRYWDTDVGSKMSCSLYWQSYLLPAMQTPVVLAISNIDILFDYPRIAREFLSLLRAWYEKTKQSSAWQQLRFVVAYASDAYVPLDVNQSPFNVGLPLKLPPFTPAQVQELAERYGLTWVASDLGQVRLAALHQLTGGHPYLVNLTLYYFCASEALPETILEQSTTEAGIYADHLRRLLNLLQANSSLEDAFKQVVSVETPVKLESVIAYKLDGLGLITRQGDRVGVSCDLYRLYFREKLLSYREVLLKLEHLDRAGISPGLLTGISPGLHLGRQSPASPQALAAPRWDLLPLQLDPLTQLANRQYFDAYLHMAWSHALRQHACLCLILIDIDYFKTYNDVYGELEGDRCLQKITALLREVVQRPADLVARYGGEEFVLLLAETELTDAVFVAETICAQVAGLKIACDYTLVDGMPSSVLTVSAGVAALVPSPDRDPTVLLNAAQQALHQSKRQGGNSVAAVQV
jgi:diguanylate cyclase (GGDEF)-like protein